MKRDKTIDKTQTVDGLKQSLKRMETKIIRLHNDNKKLRKECAEAKQKVYNFKQQINSWVVPQLERKMKDILKENPPELLLEVDDHAKKFIHKVVSDTVEVQTQILKSKIKELQHKR